MPSALFLTGDSLAVPNFFLPLAYSLHPRPRIPADKRVDARIMAPEAQSDRQMDFEQLPSFEQLVDEHQSMVFSLALRMTGDRGLAEEIAQDVFLELDRSLGRIESPAHACFWLRRVAMNRSADALRRRKVRRVDLWVEMEDVHGVESEEKASPVSTRLEALLSTLPEPQRAALVLRYQEDLTPEEIATTLQSPVATVKSHLQRGLKLLRAKAQTHLKEYVRGI
jgi:RNA polymerase sigma-70 factor (ECF subfamily)